MPWSPADAERHVKGLSEKDKKRWAAVANSVLARCQEAGEDDCDGKAVRQANGVVSKADEGWPEDLRLILKAAISKADDTCQMIFGWVSIAVQKDGTPLLDLQGDLIDIDDLELAWYEYVLESGTLNFLHKGSVRGQLCEAIVFTPAKLQALGLPEGSLPLGAWAGFYVPDVSDYQLIKSLGYFMFSIEGSALREPV